jgi:uncharacterized protein (DUF697 family)
MDTNDPPFRDAERDAIAAICLLAAQVDGLGEGERAHLRDVFDAVGGVSHARLYQDVILGRVDLAGACEALTTPELRRYAYEMAVGACDANGHTTPAEQAFLDDLASRLGLEVAEAAAVRDEAEALADAPGLAMAAAGGMTAAAADGTAADGTAADGAAAAGATAVGAAPAEAATEPGRDLIPTATDAEARAVPAPDLDRTILNRAILAGALELLPQSLGTMAIVPVQMKLVFEIGRAHGYSLDQGKVRELLAIAGVGLTSQVLEGYARKLFGKALKKTLGKGAGKVGKAASSALMTFATTYAIGKVADRYYGGGRTLSRDAVREVFTTEVARGKELFGRYQGQIQDRARTTNLSEVTRQLRA